MVSASPAQVCKGTNGVRSPILQPAVQCLQIDTEEHTIWDADSLRKVCRLCQKNKKSHEIFRSIASTVDIPNRWNPRAKQSRTVALLAALCSAALFEPLPSCGQKEKPVHNVYWFFLVRWKGLEPPDKLKTTSSDNDLTALVRVTARHKSRSVSIHTPGHRHPRQNPDL